MTITNIFKKENLSTSEYYSKGNITKETNRLKINVLNDNEITAEVNLIGKDLPTFILGVLKLPKKETGKITFIVEAIGSATLSCLDLSTKSNEIGKDVKLYKGKDVVTLNLQNDEYISFKFTSYTNYDRSGKLSIRCV